MLLGKSARLVDSLATLPRAFREFLALILDLSVKAFEDGQDRTLELFCSLVVLIGDALSIGSEKLLIFETGQTYLSVGPNVLKHAGNAPKRLVKVVTFFQWILDSLACISTTPATCTGRLPSAPAHTPFHVRGASSRWR